MSLNCLIFQSTRGTESENDLKEGFKSSHEDEANFRHLLLPGERSWSGNLVPRSVDKMRSGGTANMVPKAPLHRLQTSGPLQYQGETGTPRLVRSSGMRRDWSFEDLRRTVKS